MGFRMFGSIVPNHLPGTNMIWAFSMGARLASGWDSDKARNLQELILKIESEKKKKKDRGLIIAVPRYANNKLENFDFGKIGTEHSKFRLYIHADSADLNNPTTIVIFHNVVLKEKQSNIWRDKATYAGSYEAFTFSLSEDIDVQGAKA